MSNNLKSIMQPTTAITKELGIQYPIIQAPMAGGATTPELVAAVSNAGALGSLGAGYMSPNQLKTTIKQIRQLTDRPFAVNLFIPEEHHATQIQMEKAVHVVENASRELNIKFNHPTPPYSPSFDEQMEIILEENIPVFSFTFGIPSIHWIEKFKNKNIKLIGTATTLQEAKLLAENDIDMIVAQGLEAGGHRGTFLGDAEDALVSISTLLTTLVANIKIPIIAAGGIMNAFDISTMLKSGAGGVQIGTAFLTCKESGIHPLYKQTLLNSKNDNTTLTRAFSGKLARGIKNKFITRMQSYEDTILDYPIQNALTSEMRKKAYELNATDFMSMWAGQKAYLCKELSAEKLIEELIINN